jgi:hypothetical protein
MLTLPSLHALWLGRFRLLDGGQLMALAEAPVSGRRATTNVESFIFGTGSFNCTHGSVLMTLCLSSQSLRRCSFLYLAIFLAFNGIRVMKHAGQGAALPTGVLGPQTLHFSSPHFSTTPIIDLQALATSRGEDAWTLHGMTKTVAE